MLQKTTLSLYCFLLLLLSYSTSFAQKTNRIITKDSLNGGIGYDLPVKNLHKIGDTLYILLRDKLILLNLSLYFDDKKTKQRCDISIKMDKSYLKSINSDFNFEKILCHKNSPDSLWLLSSDGFVMNRKGNFVKYLTYKKDNKKRYMTNIKNSFLMNNDTLYTALNDGNICECALNKYQKVSKFYEVDCRIIPFKFRKNEEKVFNFYKDALKNVYISTHHKGLFAKDYKEKDTLQDDIMEKIQSFLEENTTVWMASDKKIWRKIISDGVGNWKEVKLNVKKLELTIKDSIKNDTKIKNITVDSRNHIWILCNNIVVKKHKNKNRIIIYDENNGFYTKNANSLILDEKREKVYVGTAGSGIFIIDNNDIKTLFLKDSSDVGIETPILHFKMCESELLFEDEPIKKYFSAIKEILSKNSNIKVKGYAYPSMECNDTLLAQKRFNNIKTAIMGSNNKNPFPLSFQFQGTGDSLTISIVAEPIYILFNEDSDELTKKEKQKLKSLKEKLTKLANYDNIHIKIIGYTKRSDTLLGNQRALAIENYLKHDQNDGVKNIDMTKISIDSKASSKQAYGATIEVFYK